MRKASISHFNLTRTWLKLTKKLRQNTIGGKSPFYFFIHDAILPASIA
jgi:hypothetical protein